MVSRLCVGNVYYETLDSGYTFPLAARFRYIHFAFLSRLNWATLKAFAMTASSLMAVTSSSRITHKESSSFSFVTIMLTLRLKCSAFYANYFVDFSAYKNFMKQVRQVKKPTTVVA
jgi:hypothetical protein